MAGGRRLRLHDASDAGLLLALELGRDGPHRPRRRGLGFRAVPQNGARSGPTSSSPRARWTRSRPAGACIATPEAWSRRSRLIRTRRSRRWSAATTTAPLSPLNDDCADPITVNHSELNKDDDSRTGFAAARGLAVTQTKHEWCRLLNLLQSEKGIGGASLAMELWGGLQALAASRRDVLRRGDRPAHPGDHQPRQAPRQRVHRRSRRRRAELRPGRLHDGLQALGAERRGGSVQATATTRTRPPATSRRPSPSASTRPTRSR